MFSIEVLNPARRSSVRNVREMADFDAQVSRLFNERAFTSGWAPSADVLENQNELKITLAVPGMKKEDLKIELPGNNTLSIQGERKFEKQEGVKYTRKERFYGSFTRTFALPSSVDVGKIAATYQDGILEVTLPKAEAAKARKIQINS